jgi:hypothetical protein
MTLDICGFFENLSRKFTFNYNRKRIEDTLHEDQYIFLLRMRNVITEKIVEKMKKSHFVLSKSCRLWDNVEKHRRRGAGHR